METAKTNQRRRETNWAFWVTLIFLLGLLFFSYPPLTIASHGTTLFRVDWLLASPLFGYFLVARGQVRVTKPVLLAFLFVLVAAISFLVNPIRSPIDFLTLFPQLVFAVGLFTVFASMELDRKTFVTILQIWVIILVVISVYAMYELVAINLDLPLSQLYDRKLKEYPLLADRYYRPVAVFSEPGFLSSVLITGIAVLLPPVAMGKAILFSKKNQRVFISVIIAGVIVSVAFSGYLTLVVSLVLIMLLPSLRSAVVRFWVVLIFLGLVGFIGLSSVAPSAADSLIRRLDRAMVIFSALADGEVVRRPGSIGTRWARFLSGLEAVITNPLFGVGWGQFEQWVAAVSFKYIPPDPRYGSLHGGYIQVIAQTGLIGIIIFGAFCVCVLRESLQRVAMSGGENKVLALSCTCVIIFMLVGWSHSFSVIHTVRWGFLGLCYGYISTVQD